MVPINYILVTAAGQVIPCSSFDDGLVESKKHGICHIYSLNLVDVFNANKALLVKPEPAQESQKKKLPK